MTERKFECGLFRGTIIIVTDRRLGNTENRPVSWRICMGDTHEVRQENIILTVFEP